MGDAVFLRVSVALLAGFVMDVVFLYMRLRSGLTGEEWLYFKSFLSALRTGDYDRIEDDDERSEDDGEQD